MTILNKKNKLVFYEYKLNSNILRYRVYISQNISATEDWISQLIWNKSLRIDECVQFVKNEKILIYQLINYYDLSIKKKKKIVETLKIFSFLYKI
jgi:hypothetical protein